MSPPGAVRITTMCVSRLCVGYRSAITVSDVGPKYTAVISVFLSAFFIIWAALVVLLVFGELMRRPILALGITSRGLRVLDTLDETTSSAELIEHAREAIVKEIFKRRSLVQETSPIRVWSRDMGDEICAVCIEKLTAGTFYRDLPCRHCFHVDCIDQWILQSCDGRFENVSKCPICKSAIEETVGEHILRCQLFQAPLCPRTNQSNEEQPQQRVHQFSVVISEPSFAVMTPNVTGVDTVNEANV